MGSLLPTIISLSAGLVIGVIGFFLKRTISRVDENVTSIQNIHNNFIKRGEHDGDIAECLAFIAECRADIKQIKEDYITKDDFFREQSKTDRKLDRIMDILLEMKGGEKNG